MNDPLFRIKLLMEYKSEMTNSENINNLIKDVLVNEQSVIGAPNYGTIQSYSDSKDELDKTEYPNYCRYPKNAVLPSKNSAGLSGEEALIQGFCFYSPGIFIPSDSEITFWEISSISYAVDQHLAKGYKEDKDELIRNFTKILPIGSVASFYVGGNKYNTWITKPSGSPLWEFKGYYRSGDNKPYQQPKWVDMRTSYQRFVDDYGFAIQITAAIATAIAGAFTGGAAWVLTAEIVLEAGLGIAVGLREIEKGENVSAALSFITGALPMLKVSKIFRGIPTEQFTQLSKNLAEAGLTKYSKVEDYVKFYNGLPENQQKIMSKLLTQDEITRNALLKELKVAMSDELPNLIIKEFKDIVKANPKLLKSIPFFEKLWARELSTNSFFIVLGILVNTVWGDILNAEDLEKLKGVYSVVPDDLKKEMAFNLMSNSEVLPKLTKTESFKSIEKFAKLEKKGDAWSKWFNTQLKDSIQEAGGTYTELPENNDKAVADKVGNKRDEKELRKLGFIPITELTDTNEVYDYTQLNGIDWFKIKQ